MNTEKPPYEYCALRFLMQWERKERIIHEELSRSPSPQNVRKALGYFQVSRGFPGLKTKADRVVTALKKNSRGLNNKTVISCVNGLADSFKRDFRKRNVSAASKLLWLYCRTPVVIKDSKATKALQSLGYEFRGDNYDFSWTVARVPGG